MDLPPQPPPDAPAPPPGIQARKSRSKFTLIMVIGFVAVAACIAALVPSRIFFGKPNAYRTEAINNAKQVYLTLVDFESSYGRFPDSSTIAAVQTETGTTLSLGTTTSNDLLRQLISDGNTSEKIFFAKSTVSQRKANDILGPDALKKGECGFAYVAGLSTTMDPATPVLMAPVDPSARVFERRKDYRNHAVVLFLDGSAKALPIDRHGQVQLNGMNLLDPRQPFWKGKAPDIKWPE